MPGTTDYATLIIAPISPPPPPSPFSVAVLILRQTASTPIKLKLLCDITALERTKRN